MAKKTEKESYFRFLKLSTRNHHYCGVPASVAFVAETEASGFFRRRYIPTVIFIEFRPSETTESSVQPIQNNASNAL
jgi:hypothetical protein